MKLIAAKRGRSSSAAPPAAAVPNGDDVTMQVDEAALVTAPEPKTPARRGAGAAAKRRMSEVPEDSAVPASTRTLRTRAKTPVKEEPAAATPAAAGRRKRESTPSGSGAGPSVAKRPRVSALPKPLKIGLNPLPEPYAVFSSVPDFKFDYPLPKDFDPRQGKPALTVLAAGDGTFGVLGLGEDVDRLPKFKRHKWFHDAITAATAQTNGQAQDSEMNGEGENGTVAAPKLAKDGIVEVVCGGMHTLALDADGKVRQVVQ